MQNSMEYEAKVLLSESEYEKLLNALIKFNPNKITQTNYYIDNANLELHKLGLGLRIRATQKYYEMTLKTPLKEGIKETTTTLSEEQFNTYLNSKDIQNEITNSLTHRINNLHIVGSLKTIRIECKITPHIICLDKSFYNNHVDYELEVESTSKETAEAFLKDLLKNNNITFKEFNKITKHKRALMTIKKE